MDLERYRTLRRERAENETQYRDYCSNCRQPQFGCYCSEIRKFDSKITFVILSHPIEVKRRIATGRMSHLSLENSHLIAGEDFTNNDDVNELLDKPNTLNLVLYPKGRSTVLNGLTLIEKRELAPMDQELQVFVIDGTWATARKTMRKSENLRNLPRICFEPSAPSRFRVRKQPMPGFVSTIEAIHELIEHVGEARGFSLASRQHDGLLHTFDTMVERQLQCIDRLNAQGRKVYRREA